MTNRTSALAEPAASAQNGRSMSERRTGQTLLCDADDTLWENNVYFLDALVVFLDKIEARGGLRLAAEKTLRAVEAERTKSHGYGSMNFAASLVETWRRLFGPADAATSDELRALGRGIFDHPIEPLDGVEETLAELSTRHRLLLVTKGDDAEQRGKLARSGLAPYFRGAHVLREKDDASYAAIVAEEKLDPQTTWMIGNSPKSDMNPALRTGLRAIFIPHRTIWEFEKEELTRAPDFTLNSFRDLLPLF
jgi:putative hydrolase of the HAD superfamily